MKRKTLRTAKLYWGRAANAREQLAIAGTAGHDTAKLTGLAKTWEARSRSLFASLPSSKTKELNLAKRKAANAAGEQTRHPPRALGPPPTKNWTIAQKEH
jgi:hypothetical protein